MTQEKIMSKLDMLFVRACKSSDPTKRLITLYKRFYLIDELSGRYIKRALALICEKYELLTISSFMERIENYKRLGEEYPDYIALMSAIRYADVAKFPGHIPPLRFRQPKGETNEN
jgi:hypothetical protein